MIAWLRRVLCPASGPPVGRPSSPQPDGIVPLAGPRAAPPSGHLTPHTDRVLGSVHVVPVYWGSFWTTGAGQPLVGRLNAFFDFILSSPLMQMLGEYSLREV